jgi:hypothetical protein
MLALSDTAGVILLVLGGVFVVAAAAALVLRSRVTREPTPHSRRRSCRSSRAGGSCWSRSS